MFSFFRFAQPQGSVTLANNEIKLAKKLFDFDNLLSIDGSPKNSPFPMIIYCKNQRNSPFTGMAIDNFSSKFCNDFFPSPTDVGMCMTKNLNINNLINVDEEYSDYLGSKDQTSTVNIDKSKRNAENTFVLLADIFEELNFGSKKSYIFYQVILRLLSSIMQRTTLSIFI